MSVTGGVPRVKVADENQRGPLIQDAKCGCCDCVLFTDGVVKSTSARAKKMIAADELIDSQKDTIEALRRDLVSRDERIKALTEELEKKSQPAPPAPAAGKKFSIF